MYGFLQKIHFHKTGQCWVSAYKCTTIKHTNIIYIVKEVNKNLIKHYTDFKALFGKKRHLCTKHSQQQGKN